ncbi:Hypothetical predicted protein [Olea europaea subsp. europaea]|uniref:Uncharacterized protein n=1 Tax=Olea europaea subsp. europaea TaxID=158383 RepID=A0A8S0RQ33_OLEEU|nr:Hypothetical predicted protein [Olea europaea subsp. europaea]
MEGDDDPMKAQEASASGPAYKGAAQKNLATLFYFFWKTQFQQFLLQSAAPPLQSPRLVGYICKITTQGPATTPKTYRRRAVAASCGGLALGSSSIIGLVGTWYYLASHL